MRAAAGTRERIVTGVQTCALPMSGTDGPARPLLGGAPGRYEPRRRGRSRAGPSVPGLPARAGTRPRLENGRAAWREKVGDPLVGGTPDADKEFAAWVLGMSACCVS